MHQVAYGEIGKAYGKAVLPNAKMGNLKGKQELIPSQDKVGYKQKGEITHVTYTPLA